MTTAAPDLRDFSGRIVVVGAGKMGGALLEGWLRFGLDPKAVAVLEPQPAPPIAALEQRGAQINPGIGTLTSIDAIVVAVKPQMATEALPALATMIGPSTVVVSIMAGRTLRSISDALKRPCAVVRAMPNTPAAIGRGITVAVAQNASTAQRNLAHRLLSATGTVEWVDDEALMDAVTAVSGSGPPTCSYSPKLSQKPALPPAFRRLWPPSLREKPWQARASCCIGRRVTPRPCART